MSFTPVTQRWSNLSLRTKSLLVAALPVCALLLTTILTGRLWFEKGQAERRIAQTLDIRAQVQNMGIVWISAESELRNYALNGRLEGGLVQLGILATTVDGQFKKLADLIRDRPAQVELVEKFHRKVQQRIQGLSELRTYYEKPEHRGQPPPPEIASRAKISPELIVDLVNLFANEGQLLQDEAKQSALRQTRLAYAIGATVLIGVLGGLLAALLFANATTRRIRKLDKSAVDLEEGNSPGLAFSGDDELGRLASAMERAGLNLAAQGEKLKLAFEGADLVIWELETGSGQIRYQTGTGALTTERFPTELLPDSVDKWLSVVHADDRDRVRQELNRTIAQGATFQTEYRVVLSGGELRWMTVKAQSHALGTAAGRLLGVLADITERKKASEEIERQAKELIDSREALQQQTRILQSILDSMGDGVVVADTTGKFLLFNPAAREILGSRSFAGDPDEWAKHYGLFQPDMVTLYPAGQLPFLRAIRGETVDGAEIFSKPAGAGEGNWVSVTARPLREDDGEVRGGVVVIRNITASKRAAEALQLAKKEAEDANHAKSEFLSRMSHELRTPLNSILGFAQLLELGDLTEQQADNIRHILKGGYHLLDLINEILDLARIESGRLSLSSEPVLMREVLSDALDLVRPLAVQQSINLTADAAVRCNRHIQADRQRLKQILLNLLSNAIKFNRTGGSVAVSCEEVGGKLRIDIVDTGSGISKEGIQKLFKPFERLEADRTEITGTGLGLVVSKRLVEAMGGNIGVESAVGLGSRFFVEFSTIEDPMASLQSESTLAALTNGSPRSERGTILYIEDNSSNLRLVEQILNHRPGVKLLSAMQGQLGLDLAELHRPEWILLDVHLPDIPGDEVLRRLRQNPRTRNIPVTVLSADATAGQINRLIEAGARDYLTKPLDVRKLLRLLEETLSDGDAAGQKDSLAYAERDRSK